jgi:hypothetical protein
MLESHRIQQENIGNSWEMEAVFLPEIVGKNARKFRLEYCFRNSPEIHSIRPFSVVHL